MATEPIVKKKFHYARRQAKKSDGRVKFLLATNKKFNILCFAKLCFLITFFEFKFNEFKIELPNRTRLIIQNLPRRGQFDEDDK